MKITLFYFSGTGNTWYVAKSLHELLSVEHDVAYYSIESPETQHEEQIEVLVRNSDLILIGYPIYASHMPEPMETFITKLPWLSATRSEVRKRVGIFCTQGMLSGDGALYCHDLFKLKGYEVSHTCHINMPNNLPLPAFKLMTPTTPEKIQKNIKKADKKIREFSDALSTSKPYTVHNNRLGHMIGNAQRSNFPHAIKDLMGHLIAHEGRCTKCGYCAKYCPTDNITVTEEGILFSDKCCGCTRCYNQCPATAITLLKDPNKEHLPPYKGPTTDFQVNYLKEAIY